VTVNATSPQGAAVSYTVSATDPDNPSSQLSLNCSPVSGSQFAIGNTTVNCSASDPAGNSTSGSFTVVVQPVLTASGTSVSATEGSAFSGVVATGTAYGPVALSASINWGDGNTSAGTVTLNSDGSYSVKGSHTYSEEGSFAINVTVSGSGVPNATASSSASVADAALTANTPRAVVKGTTLTLATTFTDADPSGTLSDYTASIAWGDRTTSAATIGSSSTSFSATGTHKYAKHGTYTIMVTIKDAGGSSVTKTLTITV
jgi:hypothetical protein